ncbi:MAG TPA: hypothetical protein VJG13_06625 [Thermoanaerobaculia bacterium]|nr:hypothetical protein [Thermoanaerobaculia bacterium]
MSDQSKSTLTPDDLPDSPAFRETFLTLFAPDDAECLRRAGGVLLDMILERSPHDSGEPVNAQELRAAGLDLAFLARYLRERGLVRANSVLSDLEHRLSVQAEAWAAVLDRTATEILDTVGAFPPALPEERS